MHDRRVVHRQRSGEASPRPQLLSKKSSAAAATMPFVPPVSGFSPLTPSRCSPTAQGRGVPPGPPDLMSVLRARGRELGFPKVPPQSPRRPARAPPLPYPSDPALPLNAPLCTPSSPLPVLAVRSAFFLRSPSPRRGCRHYHHHNGSLLPSVLLTTRRPFPCNPAWCPAPQASYHFPPIPGWPEPQAE